MEPDSHIFTDGLLCEFAVSCFGSSGHSWPGAGMSSLEPPPALTPFSVWLTTVLGQFSTAFSCPGALDEFPPVVGGGLDGTSVSKCRRCCNNCRCRNPPDLYRFLILLNVLLAFLGAQIPPGNSKVSVLSPRTKNGGANIIRSGRNPPRAVKSLNWCSTAFCAMKTWGIGHAPRFRCS